MDKTMLISVIVPVYKVEQYLDRCVESIVDQTYRNLEIILVDDGSPDNCGAMCDAWAQRDNRIKVIHKENGGLSDARNVGMAAASGEYIGFVDSDDWIAPDMYRLLLETAIEHNCDLAECRYFWTYGDIPPVRPIPSPQLYSKHEAMAAYLDKSAFHCVVWNKLYHRSIITVAFMRGKCHEDEFWTYQILANCNRLAHIPIYFYYYFQRNDSIMGQSYSMQRMHVIEAKANRLQFIKQHFPELEGENSVEIIFSCLYHGQMALRHLSVREQREVFRILKHLMAQTYIPYRLIASKKMTHRVWLTLSRISLPLTCCIRNLFNIGM